jgi:hypothetical protein
MGLQVAADGEPFTAYGAVVEVLPFVDHLVALERLESKPTLFRSLLTTKCSAKCFPYIKSINREKDKNKTADEE